MTGLITDRELQFLLYELLNTRELIQRPRYQALADDVLDATLDAARRLASEVFAPHYAKGDQHQPEFVDGTARVIPETARAWSAFAEAGFLNAHWDEDEGGTQLPETVFRAAMALFFGSNVATMGYPFLTIGAANLLRAFGTPELKSRYLEAMGDGRCAGTMCLTEPGQGSALGDIKAYAVPQDDGSYRVVGQKMFISGGDQNFTRNIVHMVLARIQGAPAGAGGISLFLVPKWLVDDTGSPCERNDVALAGLLHKMGWRNTTSTVLSFGEQGGARGYLIGAPGQGLAHMFHMMNEARIGVGLIAASLAYRGYAESLAYARDRHQGRLPSSKTPGSPQVRLVEHADVRRLLLAQKAYAEGALGLCLYASSLFEDQHTHQDAQRRQHAAMLLDVLTPVVKSWPARYGCVANDMAIQVLGGSGYTNEYTVEQLYRDQRLNPIHEGAEAIHGLDLLARKIRLHDGAGLALFCSVVRDTVEAARQEAALAGAAALLESVLTKLEGVSAALLRMQGQDIDLALANATVYLDVFGKVAVGWIWLQQALVATRALAADPARDAAYYQGKLAAQRYFFDWDLRAAFPILERLAAFDRTAFDMNEEWFQ
ncbi:acyl-CoA dehydrogenase [Achromobacter sp. MFA1 R4]|uniref:acyl-CoA dehydrogenase n=1 Tax=Achromobacter sp. MFA1 R4 TaxID=1881016 RepID=UPI0009539A9D|nr:acyl-CoA dehydrogenase [Achromobacter sp. MFA1 R4]SIT17933.1 butyryl-CoA dehydrogenase [Achromobacter sp. MFA1 R4]